MNFFVITASSEFVSLNVPVTAWILLLAWFSCLLLLDLLVLNRHDREISASSAIWQSMLWITLGVFLGFVFWKIYGHQAGTEYFSGYLIEKSLSVDNVFAWSVILSMYAIPKKYQHRVLFWGVFGALIMRAIFIFVGIALIDNVESILIVFGAILVYSGFKLLSNLGSREFDPNKSRLINFAQRHFPVEHKLEGRRFFSRRNGKLIATTLFVALIAVEITDAIFAVDSVPAIFAVARDPFIIFASNAAAILGLRALYFVFEKIKQSFWLLNKTLGILLITAGIKMAISPSEIFGFTWFGIETPRWLSLGSIVIILLAGIVMSTLIKQPNSIDSQQPVK